jgi:Skp family chaperone for outer membrane proteins
MTAPDASRATETYGDITQVTPPDAERAIAENIERTRADLGRTVQQLAAKTQVKSLAKEAVGDIGRRARHRAAELQSQAAGTGRQLADRLAHATDALPDQVSDAAQAAAAKAHKRWVPLASGAAALILAAVLARKLRR